MLLSQDTSTTCTVLTFSDHLKCRHPVQNIPPQWPRRCSSQKPLQSRSRHFLSSPMARGSPSQGPRIPSKKSPSSPSSLLAPQCLTIGLELPGGWCSGRVPSPCDPQVSSQRQEKLVPWSSLLRLHHELALAGSSFPQAAVQLLLPSEQHHGRWCRGP